MVSIFNYKPTFHTFFLSIFFGEQLDAGLSNGENVVNYFHITYFVFVCVNFLLYLKRTLLAEIYNYENKVTIYAFA